MNQFFKRNLAVASVLGMVVLYAAGCNFLKPDNVDVSGAKSDTNKPAAPVVVDGTRTSYADIVEKSSPAVVQITSTFKKSEAGGVGPAGQAPGGPQQGAGSGVVVNENGTILTNHHVIDGADKISVEMSDSKVYDAEVVGSDKPSDLAVLKIKGEKFPALSLGDSDSVRVGDIVLAIGNPLGIGQTVTSGIISAKGRHTGIGDGTSFQDFLQTDAPINRGNSGGALVNVNGELVGINSQILSQFGGGSIGIGFAIPSNMAKSVMDQLVKTGKVRRGMLGVNIQDVNAEIAEQFGVKDPKGVIVSNVREAGAAFKAGVKVGDIIIAVDGESVEDGNHLRNKIAGTMPGTEVTLRIVRDKKEQDIKVKLDEFDIESVPGPQTETERPGPSKEDGKLGVNVLPVNPETSAKFRIPSGVKGLVITEIDPNGPAAQSGIQPGDVIIEVNRQLVESIEDMRSAIGKSGNGGILLLISRQGQTVFVTVRP